MAFTNQTISFHSDALPPDTLILKSLLGHEQLSGMFRFELELLSKNKELKLEEIVAAPARIGIKQTIAMGGGGVGSRLREFGGVLCDFEQHEEGQGWVSYRATLVPKVSELGEFYRSRIFQGKSCPQIVKEVLSDVGLSASAPQVFGDFHFSEGITDKMRAPTKDQASYPLREYVVQYEESDWDFLARWLEHEGIYFYFENKDKRERIVFSDSSPGSEPVSRNPAEATYRFRPQSEAGSVGSSEEEVVARFVCRQTRAPKEVALNDYNWRDAVRLSTRQSVDDKGVGLQTEYNDHYKTADQGKALATVRKEELLCRTQLFYGVSNSRAMRPGKTFTLSEHYRGDWNRDYLLVSVQHIAEQSVNLEGANVTGATYHNEFTAIPLAVAFRPERLTTWPAIRGVMHGKIDSSEGNDYADLDEDGCYTVRIPYDPHFDNEDERKAGGASRRMRMAQPFSGMDAGFHFPLRKGTEVIMTHIDGDPDRPIIAGAVPNAETGNVGHHDESRNRIVTNSGNRFEIHDTYESSGFLMLDTTGSVVSDRRNRLGDDSGQGGGGMPGGGGGGARPTQPSPSTATPGVSQSGGAQREEAPGRPEGLPQPGRGMPATPGSLTNVDNSTTPAAGVGSSLQTFLDGQALKDIGKNSYVGGSETISLSSGDLDDMFKKVLAKCKAGGTIAPTTKDAYLAAVNNFDGSAFGSKLQIALGDIVDIVRGNNSYSYGDVSNAYSWGTGGFSYAEENGDTESESTQTGNAKSKETLVGDSHTESTTTGGSTGTSFFFGGVSEASFFFGGKATFELSGSATSETSIVLGGVNANSLLIGLKAEVDIFLGGQFGFELNVAPYLKFNINVTPGLEIWADPQKGEITFPHKTEIDIDKMQVALNETQAILKDTTAAVSSTNAALQDTNAALKTTLATVTNSSLSATDQIAALNQTKATVSQSNAALSAKTAALSETNTAASSVSLSGSTIIS